jgi:hypothetical protein
MSRPRTFPAGGARGRARRARPPGRGLRAVLGVSAALTLALAGAQGHAYPFHKVIDRITGHKPAPPPPPDVATQARCYGRYVAWRDAMADAIQTTNAWPASAAPVAEFDRIEASFVASAMSDRGVAVELSPDLDETALPADLRVAYDHGLQEGKARLAGPAETASQTDVDAPGAERMVQLQGALDAAFAPLRAPCASILTARRTRLAAPAAIPVALDDAPAAAAPAAQAVDQAVDQGEAWVGSERIQVGVFNHPDASSAPAADPAGAEAGAAGPGAHIALVGPFSGSTEARAFCAKVAAKGEACTVRPSAARIAKAKVKPRRRTLAPAAVRRPAQPGRAPVVLISNPRPKAPDAGLRGRLQ